MALTLYWGVFIVISSVLFTFLMQCIGLMLVVFMCLVSLQDIYTSFCNLDSKGMCYSFEVSLSGPALELHNCMAKLLSHPLQRPSQSQASYSLLEDDEPQEVEATV